MTAQEAINLLHPDTTKEAIAEIEYYCGFHSKEAAIKAIEEACLLACEALEKQVPKKPRETRCALMCANCGHKITEIGCAKRNRLYCKKCGQAIDWTKEEG